MKPASLNATATAPLPLVLSGAIVAATLTTALPGYTWALSLMKTLAGGVGTQLGALGIEAAQALAMALFGALVARAHLRSRGRWIGLLIAPLDLLLVLGAGIWTIGLVPHGQFEGVVMLATAAGVVIALALQAMVIAIVWITLALLARAYRRTVARAGSASDGDAIAGRAWMIALISAACASAVHVLIKMLPGPTAIGVVGALATCVLAAACWRAGAGRTVALAAGVGAALIVVTGGIAQTSHLAGDAAARRIARAMQHDDCASPRSGLVFAVEEIADVEMARVTYAEEYIGKGPLVVWVTPETGDSITPALRRSIERAMANILCREDFGTDFPREIRHARRRRIAIRAHGRLAPWADREVSERSLRDELARWIDDRGSDGLGTARRVTDEPPTSYAGFDAIVLNLERPMLAPDDLPVLGTLTLTLETEPDAAIVADAGADRD